MAGAVDRWRIQLLGGLCAQRADSTLDQFITRKAAGLFAYLALHPGQAIGRDKAVDLLWADAQPQRARNSLSHALSWLRQRLQSAGSLGVLQATRSAITLSDEVETDVGAFVRAVARSRDATTDGERRLEAFEQALATYQGILLPGFYDAWVLSRRRQLQEEFLAICHEYVQLQLDRDEHALALNTAERAVLNAPLREQAVLDLLRVHQRMGNRQAALQAYESFARSYNDELGAAPPAALRELVDAIGAELEPAGEALSVSSVVRPVESDRSVATWFVLAEDCSARAVLAELGCLWHESLDGVWLGVCRSPRRALTWVENVLPTDPDPLRLAIITCEASVEEADVAARGARILAGLEPGAVVCNDGFAGVLALPDECSLVLVDRGDLRARFPGEARLYSFVHGQAAAEDAEPVWGADLARFVGRIAELESVGAALERHRLVSLLGPGGMGKTRLARELWERLRSEGRCVWFVELANLAQPELVLDVVASVVAKAGVDVDPLACVRQAALQPGCVLFLDNIEHLLPKAASAVQQLLGAGENLHVVATSRRRLELQGEWCFELKPLAVLEAEQPAEASGALAVLVDQWQLLRPNTPLSTDDMHALVALARLVEGVPLALLLASGRLSTMRPRALFERLQRGFGLLSSNSASLPARHKSLSATLAWSVELLSAAQRALLMQLSHFRGATTLDAIESVCREPLALDLLCDLQATSLVVADWDGTQPFFRLYEVLRQQLLAMEANTYGPDMASRLAVYYVDLAERGKDFDGDEAREWVEEVALQEANLRHVLEWCLRPEGNARLGVRLSIALRRFWGLRRGHRESLHWLRALSERLPTGDPLWVNGVRDAAAVASNLRVLPEAEALWRKLRGACEEAGDHRLVGVATAGLGFVEFLRGQVESARAYFRQALAVFAEHGYERLHAVTEFELARTYIRRDAAMARRLLEGSLEKLRPYGPTACREPMRVLAYELAGQGEYERARTMFHAYRDLVEPFGRGLRWLSIELQLCVIDLALGRESTSVLKEVEDLAREAGSQGLDGLVEYARNIELELEAETAPSTETVAAVEASLETVVARDDLQTATGLYHVLGRAQLGCGLVDEAEASFAQAARCAQEVGYERRLPACVEALASVWERRDSERALEWLIVGQRLRETCGYAGVDRFSKVIAKLRRSLEQRVGAEVVAALLAAVDTASAKSAVSRWLDPAAG